MSEFSTNYDVKSIRNAFNLVRSIKHNYRLYKEENSVSTSYIDRDFSQYNIVLRGNEESIYDRVREVYLEEFQESVDEYNSKQKRNDRKIFDYFEKISQSNHSSLATAVLIQINDKDFWGNKSLEEKKGYSGFYEKQLEYFEELYPDFRVVSAVIHFDETSPHMHVIGVPVAKGFKKGLKTRAVQSQVFTQKGLVEEHELFAQHSLKMYKEMYDPKAKLKVTEKRKRMTDLEYKQFKEREKIEKTIEKITKKNILGKEYIPRDEFDKLWKEIESIIEKVVDYNVKNFNNKNKHKQVLKLGEELEEKLQYLTNRIEQTQKEELELEEKHKNQVEDLEEELQAQVEQAQSRANEQLAAIEEQLEIERELLKETKNKVSEENKELNKLKSENEEQKSMKAQLESTIQTLRIRESSLKKEKEKIEKFLKENSEIKKIMDLTSKKKELELKINDVEKEIREKTKTLEETKASTRKAIEKYNSKKKELDTVKLEYKNNKNWNDELISKNNKLKSENKEFEENKKRYSEDLKDLKLEIDDKSKEKDELIDVVDSLKEERRTVNLELEELRAEKEILEESKEELDKNVNALAQAKTKIRKNNIFIKKVENILGEEKVKELSKAANEEWLEERASHFKNPASRNKYRGR